MKLLKIYPSSVNERFIAEACDALDNGNTIIYPTDSLYALGCDALSSRAIEQMCRIRDIDPRKDQLSIMCADLSMAAEYARIDNRAFRYLREYLPGPFTFILPAATTLPKAFKGRHTVGIRISSNPIAVALANRFGRPIMVSTARMPGNDAEPSGEPEEIALEFAGTVDLMIDGGSIIPIASTVVDITDSSDPKVVREGAIEFLP